MFFSRVNKIKTEGNAHALVVGCTSPANPLLHLSRSPVTKHRGACLPRSRAVLRGAPGRIAAPPLRPAIIHTSLSSMRRRIVAFVARSLAFSNRISRANPAVALARGDRGGRASLLCTDKPAMTSTIFVVRIGLARLASSLSRFTHTLRDCARSSVHAVWPNGDASTPRIDVKNDNVNLRRDVQIRRHRIVISPATTEVQQRVRVNANVHEKSIRNTIFHAAENDVTDS